MNQEIEPNLTVSTNNPQKMFSLPSLMRMGGAIILIAGAVVFLLQRWDQMEHGMRYLTFLGFTIVTVLSGLFCGIGVKEDRGARTLLGIVALIIPIHFAQLGGLLYSAMPNFLIETSDYPKYFAWQAASMTEAIGLILLGVLVLYPAAYMAFSVLARAARQQFTISYFAASSLLLIPVRAPDWISLIVVASVAILSVPELMKYRNEVKLKTREGVFVRALMFLPASLLIGRTLYLYEPTYFFVGTVFFAIAAVLKFLVPKVLEFQNDKTMIQLIGVFFGALGCFLYEIGILDALNLQTSEYNLLIYGLPLGLYFLAVSYHVLGGASLLRTVSACCIVTVTTLSFLYTPGILFSLIAVSSTVLVLIAGYLYGQWGIIVQASIALGFTLINHINLAIQYTEYSPWMVLTVAGILIVISSSILERYGSHMKVVLSELKKDFEVRSGLQKQLLHDVL